MASPPLSLTYVPEDLWQQREGRGQNNRNKALEQHLAPAATQLKSFHGNEHCSKAGDKRGVQDCREQLNCEDSTYQVFGCFICTASTNVKNLDLSLVLHSSSL